MTDAASSSGDDVIGTFLTSIDRMLGWLFYTPMLYVAIVVGIVSLLFLKKSQNFALRMAAAIFLTGAVYVFLRALNVVRENEWLSAVSLVTAVVVCIWFVSIAGKDAKRWQRVIGGILMAVLVLALIFLLGAFFPQWGLTDFMATLSEFFGRVFSSAGNTVNP